MSGLIFSWNNKGLRALFFSASFLNFFMMPVFVLLPFYIEDHLNLSPDWYGYLLAVSSVGSLVGYGVAVSIRLSPKLKSSVFIMTFILISACFPLLSLATTQLHALLLIGFKGVFNGYININMATVLQMAIPGNIRGRIFGLFATLTGGLSPISMGLTGILFDMVDQNIALIYSVCGIIILILSILTSLSKNFRDLLLFEKARS